MILQRFKFPINTTNMKIHRNIFFVSGLVGLFIVEEVADLTGHA